MIKYLVIGSNNFWYAACTTKKQALDTVKGIKDKESYKDFVFGDPESSYYPKQPSRIYIYKVNLILDQPTNKLTNK